MLNSRTARIVIALLAAILIWGYVVGEVNPAKTKTIRNIPVTYTYEETLNERGLAVSQIEDEFINIEISGARAIIGDINPNDISATINVASAQKGDNDMSISIRVPSGITVNKQSEIRTIVTVENLTQKAVNVEIGYMGEFAEGDQGHTVNMSASQVIVSGAESLVDSVKLARGSIDATQVGESLTAIPCQLEAVAEGGDVISGVRLSQRNISVTAVIAREKTVKANVAIKDTPSEEYIRTVEVPEEVTIYGAASALEDIDEVTSKEIDISDILKNTEIKLEFILPKDVEVFGEDVPTAKVTVDPIEEKTFEYSASDVELVGAKPEYKYTLPEDQRIMLFVRDKKSVLDSLKKTSFNLSVDVSQLTASGDVVITVAPQDGASSILTDPVALTVMLETVSETQTEGN